MRPTAANRFPPDEHGKYPVRFDMPVEEMYSAVYLDDVERVKLGIEFAERNFASVNAGDSELYVGGGGINGLGFAEALRACGHEQPKNKYMSKYITLHEELLGRAAAAPGTLCRVRHGEVFKRPDSVDDAAETVCKYCQQLTQCWTSRLDSWSDMGAHCEKCWRYWEDWWFRDVAAFAGMLPEGDHMQTLWPVGLTSITVFPAGKRPCDNDKNVAMVYCIGPNCGSKKLRTQRPQDKMSKEDFVNVLETIGSTITAAILAHNQDAVAEIVPVIEVLRLCLISGDVYKHKEASKVEVAAALIKGLGGLSNGVPQYPCALDFAYSKEDGKDVFRTAWRHLGLPGGG
eukprot:TRINITY_DN64168_c0_g1_i1.p1 TRINITY_DN64168_c0_g1~~TRINITY_DN64168_c0_g1_i1.p1  ORF type:complete len:344 (-),score=29.40 TRINITY_DN64168_c0_g1_i1:258-1289(-)